MESKTQKQNMPFRLLRFGAGALVALALMAVLAGCAKAEEPLCVELCGRVEALEAGQLTLQPGSMDGATFVPKGEVVVLSLSDEMSDAALQRLTPGAVVNVTLRADEDDEGFMLEYELLSEVSAA